MKRRVGPDRSFTALQMTGSPSVTLLAPMMTTLDMADALAEATNTEVAESVGLQTPDLTRIQLLPEINFLNIASLGEQFLNLFPSERCRQAGSKLTDDPSGRV